jgi:hypothetical protein
MTTTATKLDRLTVLRDTLLELRTDSTDNADEWNTYNEWLIKATDLLTEERRRQGWMAVYPIVGGCSQEVLFEGTSEQCQIYVSIMKEHDPKADIIVLQL